MELILSTTGIAERSYLGDSQDQVSCPQVEDMRWSRRVSGPDGGYKDRSTVHLKLDQGQAIGIAVKLLMALVDEGVLQGWNLKYSEQATPEDDDALLDEVYGVDRPEPCKHGHLDCSTVEGGACANEEYARRLTAKHG